MMDCPNCRKRELAVMERVMRKGGVLTIPADVDRLWCPACGDVTDRPREKKKGAPAPARKVAKAKATIKNVKDKATRHVPRRASKKGGVK